MDIAEWMLFNLSLQKMQEENNKQRAQPGQRTRDVKEGRPFKKLQIDVYSLNLGFESILRRDQITKGFVGHAKEFGILPVDGGESPRKLKRN